MLTGSPTLHRRLPSLCMQARSLGYSTVWANRAGSQSTNKLRHCCLSLGWDGFPSESIILLDHLNQSSSNLIIQGWVAAAPALAAFVHPAQQSGPIKSMILLGSPLPRLNPTYIDLVAY